MNTHSAAFRSLLITFTLLTSAGLLLAGDAPPRAARSVHLSYPAPPGMLFYNELTVEASTPGSYFMACGFNHGYFGIQELMPGEGKVVLFSVWDPGQQDDPGSVAQDQRVEVLHQGDDVRVKRFGGEGTGGQSIFSYPWKIGETCRFLVHASTNANQTAFAAWFYLNDRKSWKHLVTFQTLTKGEPLRGYYSFIEDFRRDTRSVRDARRARFGNGWVKTTGGDWLALTRATFTASGAEWEAKDNIDAGLSGSDFFLITGGDTKNTLPLRSVLSRPPALDLPPLALP
jgi:hypothetical protein